MVSQVLIRLGYTNTRAETSNLLSILAHTRYLYRPTEVVVAVTELVCEHLYVFLGKASCIIDDFVVNWVSSGYSGFVRDEKEIKQSFSFRFHNC